MNKKHKLIPLGFVSALCLGALPFIAQSVSADSDKYLVYFMDNYEREGFELSSGFVGKGNNLPYQIVEVQANSKVAKPSIDPSRKNYEFGGWYKEATCENEWSFARDIVSKNTFIYAKWSRGEEEIIPEPEYVPPSTVLDESAPTPYVLNSVMGFVPNGTILRVSNVAITRLIEYK
ncbi:MAG: InlB B-repeat-containing protein, partial [Bacilli bacterium]|nr:InlB B-repeat-containing protein [Bacilli bacterium]